MTFADNDDTIGQSFSTKVERLPNGQFQATCKNVDLGTFRSDSEVGAQRLINDAIDKYLKSGRFKNTLIC